MRKRTRYDIAPATMTVVERAAEMLAADADRRGVQSPSTAAVINHLIMLGWPELVKSLEALRQEGK